LAVDEQPLTSRTLFKPQEYVGSLKLADATADISAIREEWERTVIPGGNVGNLANPVTAMRESFKGKLSNVDAFMAAKQVEKEFEL
jgi:hypothetical protein